MNFSNNTSSTRFLGFELCVIGRFKEIRHWGFLQVTESLDFQISLYWQNLIFKKRICCNSVGDPFGTCSSSFLLNICFIVFVNTCAISCNQSLQGISVICICDHHICNSHCQCWQPWVYMFASICNMGLRFDSTSVHAQGQAPLHLPARPSTSFFPIHCYFSTISYSLSLTVYSIIEKFIYKKLHL